MKYYYEFGPGFEYGFNYGPSHGAVASSISDGLLAVLIGAAVLAVLAVMAAAALAYVLRALSLHTMAKNRGLENAWLAWVPVGCNWLLGQIADDINRRQGKKTNYSLVLLVLSAAAAAGGFSLVLLPLSALFSAALSIAVSVVYFIALYDIYQDYAPKNAVVFLVLSILLSLQWLLLFILRDRLPLTLNGDPQNPTAHLSPQHADPGWQPVEYTPQPSPANAASQPVSGWTPEGPQQQGGQPPKECPPEHWGGIVRVEQPEAQQHEDNLSQ